MQSRVQWLVIELSFRNSTVLVNLYLGDVLITIPSTPEEARTDIALFLEKEPFRLQ